MRWTAGNGLPDLQTGAPRVRCEESQAKRKPACFKALQHLGLWSSALRSAPGTQLPSKLLSQIKPHSSSAFRARNPEQVQMGNVATQLKHDFSCGDFFSSFLSYTHVPLLARLCCRLLPVAMGALACGKASHHPRQCGLRGLQGLHMTCTSGHCDAHQSVVLVKKYLR